MFVFFDRETADLLPKNRSAKPYDINQWPRVIEIAYEVYSNERVLIEKESYLISPNGFNISKQAYDIHGISTNEALSRGVELTEVLNRFAKILEKNRIFVAHNYEFDRNVLGAEYIRCGLADPFEIINGLCTMKSATEFCAIQGAYGFKWPTLEELHFKLFNNHSGIQHRAAADVAVLSKSFFNMLDRNIVAIPPDIYTNSGKDSNNSKFLNYILM
jgi:DNA polymerase III epsilon subunit-like protein